MNDSQRALLIIAFIAALVIGVIIASLVSHSCAHFDNVGRCAQP